MTDLEQAKQRLQGHALCLCRGETYIVRDGSGIAPMMELIEEGADLLGFSAADILIGKAVAMLFVKAGVTAVHGLVMSEAADVFLTEQGIAHSCDRTVSFIENRDSTGPCPMEATVADLTDVEEAYLALKEKRSNL